MYTIKDLSVKQILIIISFHKLLLWNCYEFCSWLYFKI